jgi:hypothetical protein
MAKEKKKKEKLKHLKNVGAGNQTRICRIQFGSTVNNHSCVPFTTSTFPACL